MTTQVVHHTRASISRNRVVARRDFLKGISVAALAAGGLSWTDLLSLQAGELRRRGMACITLWMGGGPSQFETFSPLERHENGGGTKSIATAVPGIRFADSLPEMAKLAKECAVIRSMTSKEGNHVRAAYLLHTGYLPTPTVKYPALGAVAAHQLADKACELPSYVRIGRSGLSDSAGGFLGVEFDPFVLGKADRPPENTAPATTNDRFQSRQQLLARMEADYASSGGAEQVADHRKLYDQASRMIMSRQMRAFDLAQEPEKMRTAYGEGAFASGCLMARRLVEEGVTFVEVTLGGWDTHGDNFNQTRKLAEQVDRPMAQLIADLKQRGMLERTLVVWMGEFGRTPKVNARSGRDHYPQAFNVVLAGGGVRGGQVIGRVTPDGAKVADRPVTVPDLFRSFCHSLKINPDAEQMTPIGRPIKIVDGGKVVNELFG
ncbi:MAG: DUF1501 domain-containing protein [Planctomycetia bacterium]|nr:DUF1501 domain-containing protein [Planctomycetia bacterium]